jgi:sucrose-6-phosphate hydrolase SacC (GH32 family)
LIFCIQIISSLDTICFLRGALMIGQRESGETSFSEKFPSVDKMLISEIDSLTLFLDKSSIELFVNEGKGVLTELPDLEEVIGCQAPFVDNC